MASWRAYICTADVPPALAPLTRVYCKQRIISGGLRSLALQVFPNARHGGSTPPDANNVIVDEPQVQQVAAVGLLKLPIYQFCHLCSSFSNKTEWSLLLNYHEKLWGLHPSTHVFLEYHFSSFIWCLSHFTASTCTPSESFQGQSWPR